MENPQADYPATTEMSQNPPTLPPPGPPKYPTTTYHPDSGAIIYPPVPVAAGPSVSYQYPYRPPGLVDAPPGGFVVITQPAAPPNQHVPVPQSFTCHYVLSCLTFWFCGFLFGGIAFILAAVGSCKRSDGEHSASRQLATASLALSIIGIICGCAMWGVIIWLIVGEVDDDDYRYCRSHSINGNCYRYRDCYTTSTYCYYNYCSQQCYYSSSGCCYYGLGYYG